MKRKPSWLFALFKKSPPANDDFKVARLLSSDRTETFVFINTRTAPAVIAIFLIDSSEKHKGFLLKTDGRPGPIYCPATDPISIVDAAFPRMENNPVKWRLTYRI